MEMLPKNITCAFLFFFRNEPQGSPWVFSHRMGDPGHLSEVGSCAGGDDHQIEPTKFSSVGRDQRTSFTFAVIYFGNIDPDFDIYWLIENGVIKGLI